MRRFIAFAVLAAAGLNGCSHHFSSSTSNSNPPLPGSYSLTVTASAGSLAQSTGLTLNVQ